VLKALTMESEMPKGLARSYTFFHCRAASGAGAIITAGTLMKVTEALAPASVSSHFNAALHEEIPTEQVGARRDAYSLGDEKARRWPFVEEVACSSHCDWEAEVEN
jgi:hypothetical protein